ncbi:uncharacterized protein HD556DRAFT_1449726 [Suillus plorans]|uniref:Uncharacterized protein n=1 Tax=Suillus plorans TaxID=116603 RepID=A0A9P7AE65_9AGAM|nr:uncharacterized protein HD556DRAFT_1449726 [Suillus plorans]KAG1786489.1 hypothetical protein HD556DRAFT_1449726 [Suillus plorans]
MVHCDDLVDGRILQFCDHTQKCILCTLCPRTLFGAYHTIELCFTKKHIETARHEHYVENTRNGQMASLNPVFKAQLVKKSLKERNCSIREFGLSRHIFMDADDFSMELGIHDTPDTMDLEIPLPEFLDDIARSQTVEFSKGVTDFFAELQETLASGQVPFSTPLVPITKDDKLVYYGAPDFGLEILGTHIIFSKLFSCLKAFTCTDIDLPETRAILDTNCPTYPWPSKAVSSCHISHMMNAHSPLEDFVTALLFSSPRLPFSDAQKKATLNWAKELGVRNVPSLYAIKKCQKFVEDLLGQPTEKVTLTGQHLYNYHLSGINDGT